MWKPLVRISHSAPRSSQASLDRALAQLNSGQRSEHDGNPPHRYAHSIVEHVSRMPSLVFPPDGRSHRTGQVQRPDDALAHACRTNASAYQTRYSVAVWASGECRSRSQGSLPHVEYASTSGALSAGNRNVNRRCCQFVHRHTVAEVPLPGLSTRTPWLRRSIALGEWRCLALARSLRRAACDSSLIVVVRRRPEPCKRSTLPIRSSCSREGGLCRTHGRSIGRT